MTRSVLLISFHFFPEATAASVRVKYFLEAFTEKGIKTYAVVSSRLENSMSFKTYSVSFQGSTIYSFKSRASGFLIDPTITLSFFVRAIAFSLLNKPKIIIATVPPVTIAFVAFCVAKIFLVPVVIDVRDVVLPKLHKAKKMNHLLFQIIKFVYKHANLVTTVTKSLSSHLQSLGVPKEKIKIVRNGADTKLFHPISPYEIERARDELDLSDTEMVLIFVGDLNDDRHKLGTILKSLKAANDQHRHEVGLIVIGNGKYKAKFEKMAKILGLKRVRFLGRVRTQDLARYIASSDIGLVSYADDKEILLPVFPTKAYEYLACGKPIIAAMSVDTELCRFLNNKHVGVLVDPENPLTLSESIVSLLTDASLLKSMSENAKSVSVLFDRRKQAREFVCSVLQCIE